MGCHRERTRGNAETGDNGAALPRRWMCRGGPGKGTGLCRGRAAAELGGERCGRRSGLPQVLAPAVHGVMAEGEGGGALRGGPAWLQRGTKRGRRRNEAEKGGREILGTQKTWSP